MKIIGFHAAMTLAELGSASDVLAFFKAVSLLLEGGQTSARFPLISEKLYRRLIKQDELKGLQIEMDLVRSEFKGIRTQSVNLKDLGVETGNTKLNVNGLTLGDVFEVFFTQFNDVVECTNAFVNEFGQYVPVRIGVVSVPDYMEDEERDLRDYEDLQGDPFWIR